MRFSISVLAAALLAGSPAALFAQDMPPAPPSLPAPPAPPQSVTLRYKYTAGEIRHFHVATDSSGTITTQAGKATPLKQHSEMTIHKAVKSIDPKTGAATLEFGIDSMGMTLNGNPMPLPAAQTAKLKEMGTMVISPTGKVLSFRLNTPGNTSAPGQGFGEMQSITGTGSLPAGAVKAGDTWQNMASLGVAAVKATASSTLKSIGFAKGKVVANIQTRTQGTINSQPAKGAKTQGTLSGASDTQFDVNGGDILQQSGVANIHMTLTLPGSPVKKKPSAPSLLRIDMQVTSTMVRSDAPLPDATKAAQR